MEISTSLSAKSMNNDANSSMRPQNILKISSLSSSSKTPNANQSSTLSLSSNVETSLEKTATKVERYIPFDLNSTVEDAPGWQYKDDINTKEINNNKETFQCSGNIRITENSKISNIVGPVCWKCKGLGYNHVRKKKNKKKRQKLDVSILSGTNEDNYENKQRRQNTTACPVCQGSGHIQCKEKELKYQNRAGVITKTRSCPTGWKSKKPLPYVITTQISSKTTEKEITNDEKNSESDFRLFQCIQQIYNGLSQDVSINSFFLNKNHTQSQEEQINQLQSNPLPIWLPREGEQLCNLVGSWRILQRVGSHRWTTDDLVTAHVASSQFISHFSPNDSKNTPIRYLDLGCGNGSVLQMVLWKLLSHYEHDNEYCTVENGIDSQQEKSKETETIEFYVRGIEARSEAVELAKRSLSYNIGSQESKTKINDNKDMNDCVDGNEAFITNRNNLNVQLIHNDFRTLIEHGAFIFNDQSHTKNLKIHKSDERIVNKSDNSSDTNLQFDLVTGTPPYFQVDFQTITLTNNSTSMIKENLSCRDETKLTKAIINQGGMPTCMQSAPARCEFRGGIEVYCQAASKVLKPKTGIFVVCENYLNHKRVLAAADECGLAVKRMYFVKGRIGKRVPLFAVYMMMMKDSAMEATKKKQSCNSMEQDAVKIELSVRDDDGKWTDAYKDVLEDMAIPAY